LLWIKGDIIKYELEIQNPEGQEDKGRNDRREPPDPDLAAKTRSFARIFVALLLN